jgi:hypothetical protein
VNGKVVSRGANKDRVEATLVQKYGMPVNVEASNNSPAAVFAPEAEFGVDERFQFIEQFVRLIAKKSMNSLIITGDGGLGKTFTVISTLKKLGLKELGIGDYDGDFVIIKGYSTAKAMYRTLWENNGKIILFDDADSVHKDPIGANILKGALDSEEKRVITWGAEFSDKEELPNRFEFTGRVIFISNLPLKKFPQALLSRSMKVDLTLNTEEKLERIEHVFGEVRGDEDEKQEVLEFIRENASRITDLNIRSALNVLKLRTQIDQDWERIALYTVIA